MVLPQVCQRHCGKYVPELPNKAPDDFNFSANEVSSYKSGAHVVHPGTFIPSFMDPTKQVCKLSVCVTQTHSYRS